MPARFPWSLTLVRITALGFVFALLSYPLWGQRPPSQPTRPSPGAAAGAAAGNNPAFDLDIAVRDSHGILLDVPAVVRLNSVVLNYNVISFTQRSSTAHFSNLSPGEYEVEVTCPGFRKLTDRIILEFSHESLPVYIYLVPESDAANTGEPPRSFVLPPQLRAEMQKGMGALNKDQYEAARKIFAKVLQKAPSNPDVVYFLGLAELGLQHLDQAREDFQRALSLDPNHELALVSLGHLQLRSGAPADAIISLEKAVALGRTGWRANFELAYAYVKVNRLSDAELEASRATHLAKEKGAAPSFLLGQIQYAEGKRVDAKRTWASIVQAFPKDPVVPEAERMLARLDNEIPEKDTTTTGSLPLSPVLERSLVTLVERPWAPPDTDIAVYDITPDVSCKTEPILDAALHRMNSELVDFEKFTATEHIEHQDIDRYGWPGPAKSHDFSYVVFVHPLGKDSFYLDEFRDGAGTLSGFSDVIITTGLNSLGVNVLQPFYRDRFNYSCEGLANLRGQAAWQIHFEEKRGAKGEGVRAWHWGPTTYDIPIKGRIWVSSASYSVLRIETDLRDPIAGLELTKDHLLVDYGPVNFSSRNVQLWLPRSADMYMEFRGKRYHHRHFLSDYLLFDVDATHKVENPKGLSPPPGESSP